MTTKTNELADYLADAQSTACRLSAVLEGLTALNNEGLAGNACFVLAEIADEMAEDLNSRLDSAAIPNGTIQ